MKAPAALGRRIVAKALVLAGSLTLTAQGFAQSAPLPSYRAPWIAVASPEPVSVTVKEKAWATVMTFRPVRALVLERAAVEQGQGKERVPANSVMIAMDDRAAIACQAVRPRGRYFIGCVEDYDGDGTYDGSFLLNHGNPFLFSAIRQPRHRKSWPINQVRLRLATEAETPSVEMVLLFQNRAEMAKTSIFQFCVLRSDNRNIWGDDTVARGCLPPVAIKDGGPAVALSLYGRDMVLSVPETGIGRIDISAQPETIPVQL